jgi:hypothetical protein
MTDVPIYIILPVMHFLHKEFEWFISNNRSIIERKNVKILLKLNNENYQINDERIIVVSQKDTSIYSAWNQALNEIKNIENNNQFYVIFCGIDDTLDETFFQMGLSVIKKNYDIIFGNISIDLGGKIISRKANPNSNMLCFSNHKAWDIFHPGMLMKGSLFNEIQFSDAYKLAGDFNFFAQISNNYEIHKNYIDQPQGIINLSGISNDPAARKIYIQEFKKIERELGIKITGFNKCIETIKFWLLNLSFGNKLRAIYWRYK